MTGLQALHRISDGLNRIVIAVCAALVVVMLSLSTLGIFFETLFTLAESLGWGEFYAASPLDWAYSHTRPSLTRLFLPWLAMLSVTVAFKFGEHIAIALAVRNLPPRWLFAVQAVNLTAVAFFAAALVWYGYGFFINSTQIFMVSELLQISHKWTAASVPATGIIMCVHLLSGISLVEQHMAEPEPAE